jgi:hypothetical protein
MGSKKTKLIYNLWTTSEWIRQSVRAIAVPIPESGRWSKAAWGRDLPVTACVTGDNRAKNSHSSAQKDFREAAVRGYPLGLPLLSCYALVRAGSIIREAV